MQKHEIIISSAKAELNKEQEKFNKLITQLDKIENELADTKKVGLQLRSEYTTEVQPLEKELNDNIWAYQQKFDLATRKIKMGMRARETMNQYFIDAAKDQLEEGNQEAMEMYNYYSDKSYEDHLKETEAMKARMTQNMFEENGIDTSEMDIDWSNPESVMEAMQAKMEEAIEAEKLREEKRKERKSKKPKTEKQAVEAIAETELGKIKRNIYMELVKRYHPDRYSTEPDKIRAGETMQRITDAYEQGDMLALLKLQNELGTTLEGTQASNLAEHQLKELNKQLNVRLREIKSEIGMENHKLEQIFNQRINKLTPASGEWLVRHKKEQIRREIKSTQADMKNISDPQKLKKFVNDFVRSASSFGFFGKLFGF
jgi:hypothetical protein